MRGAIVPHAPLLLPELESAEVAASAATIRTAAARLDPGDAEIVAILSSHGPQMGIYREVAGDLREFGLPTIAAGAPAYDFWSETPGSERVALDVPADHGVVVALRLLDWHLPVIALAAADSDARDPEAAATSAHRAARLIKLLATRARVEVVASVNTSANLGPRSPYPNTSGQEAEDRLLEIIRTDVGLLTDEAAALTAQGHSCGLSPLLVLAELFAGTRMEVLAHEAPVGVGYLVAQTT